jgi:hypothetical protein
MKPEKSVKCEVEKKKSIKDSPSVAVASTSSPSTSAAKTTPKPLPKGIGKTIIPDKTDSSFLFCKTIVFMKI